MACACRTFWRICVCVCICVCLPKTIIKKEYKQTGDGHFSPIGGYHKATDTILVLDVARFKYPPHWVSVSSMYAAMLRLDPTTNECRGYVRQHR